MTTTDIQISQSPSDSVSSLAFSPVSNHLAASSWNKEVYVWEIQQNGQAVPKAKTNHLAPVLCCDFSSDGQRVFSGGCDNTAKMWTLATNQTQNVAQHDAPIKELFWLSTINMLVTGSWDKSLRYWDFRQQRPAAAANLPERLYCMDVDAPLLVCGTAERHILIYDIRKPTACYRQFPSALKMQTRCISCFPDKTGFAYGSIEGRVAISHVEQKDNSKNFAFKCHRHNNEVYAVNSISFHPYGTFATCGSDGTYVFWDKDAKQRLKAFDRNSQPITASTFNRDGTIFAYALGYDWSKGIEFYDKTKGSQIMLHGVQDAEIKPKEKR